MDITYVIFEHILLVINYLILFYFVGLNGTYLLLNFISFIKIRHYLRASRMVQFKRSFTTGYYKPVSVIAPAYNEEASIVSSVNSLLQLEYPQFEVIVVNDGSKDSTLQRVIDFFEMRKCSIPVKYSVNCNLIREIYISEEYPNLILVDKENGGKADALNAGLNISQYPLVSAIDADSLLERQVMLRLAYPFLERPETVATGGIVRVLNGCSVESGEVTKIDLPHSPLAMFQVVEYLRAFLFGRIAWEPFNGILIISGAFGLFRKETVISCGGYRSDTIGEDMELVVRMHRMLRKDRKPYRISFIPEPICWTEAPEDLISLGKQRNRWQRGLIDSMLSNIAMLLNPRYGWVGMVVMPFFFFFEMLGPVIEVLGFTVFVVSLYLGVVDFTFAILFLSVSILLGIVLSSFAVILDEMTFRRYPKTTHLFKLFLFAVFENFGYRQINSWWRVKGFWLYLKGDKAWGNIKRKGF